VQNGRIVISLTNEGKDSESDTQILYFEEAKCFSLSEYYNISVNRRRLLKLAISAETMEIDGVSLHRI
jgi:predicted methyltransferase